jgi:hypothetical protein
MRSVAEWRALFETDAALRMVGLAYLEAILRLADWQASDGEQMDVSD